MAESEARNLVRIISVSLALSGLHVACGEDAIISKRGETVRNELTADVGMKFEVRAPVTVSHLGRWRLPGNKEEHLVRLFAGTNEIARVRVDTKLAPNGQIQYVALSNTVTCLPGVTYHLFSGETKGGDKWYDFVDPVTLHPLVNLINAAWNDGGTFKDWKNGCYGPVSFRFTMVPPPAIDPRSKLAWEDPNPVGSISNWVAYADKNGMVRTALTSVAEIDFRRLLQDAPAGDYSFFIRAVSTNGLKSDPSTNIWGRWAGNDTQPLNQ